jgi:hypothetical protein
MLLLLLSDKCFKVHSLQMGACSVVTDILSVVFSFGINPEQIQILTGVRSHVYLWFSHMEEDFLLFNMFDT